MLHLIIANKNYSSWSFRPWLAMRVAGIPFEETVISLDAPDFKARVTAVSGAGSVPVLVDGDVRVWESLAILEYLAEKFPAADLWPRDSAARAHARAVASEMHAGFVPLRRQLPMNMWRPPLARLLEPDATANVTISKRSGPSADHASGQRARSSMDCSERRTPCMRR
jgi:glutathione S-transferase